MATPVEQIKERLSIVDVVGSYIKLAKAGSSYKALCPFHNEKSPSFNVSPSREAFYCFGCNRGGDIFTFVESIEGVEFIDALKILAERAGVELKREASESRTERDKLLELMEEVTVFYQRHMLENSAVKEYLTGRGLTEATIRSFRIGYALLDWRLAYDHLHSKGFSDQEIERAGLIKTVEGKSPYDRFRGRVMFPIFDANGHVVAFSGRVFGEQKNQDGTDVAKYLNSPEGPLYDKSSIMFGYDRAKKSIRSQNFTILVEGQMDLIMSHQAGTENTVAVSGTALTEKHLVLLKRLSDNLVFAFDADEAGLNATARAFRLALALGMGVRVAAIPVEEGEEQKNNSAKDPADYIHAHTDPTTGVSSAWAQVIASSQHIIDFYLTTLSSRGYDARTFRQAVEDKVLPLVIEMQSKIEQAHFIIEIARKLGVPDTAVWEEVKRIQLAQRMSEPARGANQSTYENSQATTEIRGAPIKTRRQVAEEEIIGIILWQESLMGAKPKVASNNASNSTIEAQSQKSTNESLLDIPITEPAIDVIVIRQTYHERIESHGLTPYSPGEDERRTFSLKAEYKYEHGPQLEHSIHELLDTIEEEVLKEKQAALWQKLSEAEAKGAKDEAKTFLEQYQQITPRIIALEDRRMKRN